MAIAAGVFNVLVAGHFNRNLFNYGKSDNY